MSISSSAQINEPNGDDTAKDTQEMQDVQPKSGELEGRKRTLTEKGFEYQLPFKKKSYEDALTKLRNCVDKVDMLWTDASEIDELRQLRNELEESRQAFEIAQSGYAPFLSEEELQELCSESSDLLKRTVQLRKNAGERIFALEKDEIKSRSTARSSSSKKTRNSNVSEIRAKAVIEAAKRKVEWQYAKREMQKKLELKMKECEIEEMQKKKDYERAEAEVAALAKVEDEEEKNEKHIPDSLDSVPCTIDKEQQVRQYLSSIPTSSIHINTGSPNPMDQQQNIPVSVISTSSPAMPLVSSNLMDQQQNIPVSVISTSSPAMPLVSSNLMDQQQNIPVSVISTSSPARPLNQDIVSSNIMDQQQNIPVSLFSNVPPVLPSHSTVSTPVAHRTPGVGTSMLRPVATSFSPLYAQSTMPTFSTPLYSAVNQRSITDAITESFQAARMPPPNLTVFTGNPLDWPTWKSAFETVVEKRAINPSERSYTFFSICLDLQERSWKVISSYLHPMLIKQRRMSWRNDSATLLLLPMPLGKGWKTGIGLPRRMEMA